MVSVLVAIANPEIGHAYTAFVSTNIPFCQLLTLFVAFYRRSVVQPLLCLLVNGPPVSVPIVYAYGESTMETS